MADLLRNGAAVLVVVFVILSGIACFAEADPVLAVVGGIEIRQSDLERQIQEVPLVARQNFRKREGQLELLDRMIRTKAMMRAAEDAGYEDDPEIQYQIRNQRERILAFEYFQRYLVPGPMPPEEQMLAYYEQNRDERYKREISAEARQIVLESEKQAKDVLKKLNSGKLSFSDAVEQFGIDESREDGGYLGVLTENSFIRGIGRSRPFLDMVFSLQPGKISEPFQTRMGWHLVEILRITGDGYRPFDEVRNEIARELLITVEEMKKEYNENSERYSARERCKISHILVRTKDDAEKVLAELQQGKDFGYLVKNHSIDLQTTSHDGNLGYFYRGGYVRGVGQDAEFEKAVFALSEGQISAPIETRRGWHIVRIDEKDESMVRPFIEVEAQIRKKLTEEKIESFQETKFEELRQQFDVTIFEDRIQDL